VQRARWREGSAERVCTAAPAPARATARRRARRGRAGRGGLDRVCVRRRAERGKGRGRGQGGRRGAALATTPTTPPTALLSEAAAVLFLKAGRAPAACSPVSLLAGEAVGSATAVAARPPAVARRPTASRPPPSARPTSTHPVPARQRRPDGRCRAHAWSRPVGPCRGAAACPSEFAGGGGRPPTATHGAESGGGLVSTCALRTPHNIPNRSRSPTTLPTSSVSPRPGRAPPPAAARGGWARGPLPPRHARPRRAGTRAVSSRLRAYPKSATPARPRLRGRRAGAGAGAI